MDTDTKNAQMLRWFDADGMEWDLRRDKQGFFFAREDDAEWMRDDAFFALKGERFYCIPSNRRLCA